jgi:RNA processing factor Prp31
MSLYQQLRISAKQLEKLAKERKAIWPPPITFSQMGKFEKPKGASDKDDKKDAERYLKFEVPINVAVPNSDKYERKVKIFYDGKPFDWCQFRENADDLFEAFGCAGPETNQANMRHHLYIALFAGRAKELYQRNYNQLNAANNALPIEDQSTEAELLKEVVNETAKSFFDSWDSALQEQQQYMRQICSWAT